jgi:hypothetical protein
LKKTIIPVPRDMVEMPRLADEQPERGGVILR